MEPEVAAILTTAKTQNPPPEGWTVIPLDRRAVGMAILGWGASALLGLGLFALLLATVYPDVSIIIGFFLLLLGFVAVGSLWLVMRKTRQLLDAGRQIIVMTPDTYIQQRGSTTIAVPMHEIANITLRGVFGHDVEQRPDPKLVAQEAAFGMTGMGLMGARTSPRRRRTPDSLAFVDKRTNAVVIIAEDNAFTQLGVIDDLLRTYVLAAQRAKH